MQSRWDWEVSGTKTGGKRRMTGTPYEENAILSVSHQARQFRDAEGRKKPQASEVGKRSVPVFSLGWSIITRGVQLFGS